MYTALVLVLFLTSQQSVRGQLIRSVDVYQEIIQGIHDYFKNTCIILLHSTANPIESQGIEEGMQLQRLQAYLSGRHIRTAYMDFSTFTSRVGYNYFHIKRPLFVLLNDSDDVKHDFSHVTGWIDMSYPTWLIFFRDETSISDFFMEIYVPFDCTFMVAKGHGNESRETITEIYQVDRGKELRHAIFGTWHPKHGITTPSLGLYQRRNDLFGQTIRVASIHDPPGSMIVRDDDGNMTGLDGFFGGILQLLEENMNCTFILVFRADPFSTSSFLRFCSSLSFFNCLDGFFGGILQLLEENMNCTFFNCLDDFFGGILQLLEENMNCTIAYQESLSWGYFENGTWTGAIGLLTQGKVDIVAAELMMTADRLEAIDFTTPLYTTKCRAYIKRPFSSSIKWKAYLTPFHSGIWTSIGVLIVVTSITISLVKSIVPILLTNVEDVANSPTSFTDIILAVFGAFCSQGMDQSLLDPIRIIHLVIHLTGVVVLAAYSAALISSLAVKTFVMPFTTMEGLLEDGTYRFGVVSNSADYSFFQNTSDNVLEVLFDEILTKETTLPSNYFEGLKNVCAEEKYAFMTLDNVVSQLQPKVSCKLEPLDTIMQSSIAMGVRPRSPYRQIINSNILLIRDSGILQRLLHSEWMLTATNLGTGWSTVEIGDVLPLVLVILLGAFFSLLTLGSESVVSKRLLPTCNKRSGKLTKTLKIDRKRRNILPANLTRF